MLKKLPGGSGIELRITGFDGNDKTVPRHFQKCIAFEKRIVVLREQIGDKHPAQRTEGCQKNGQLVHDRERENWTEERLTADNQRIIEGSHIPDHESPEGKSSHTTEKGEDGHFRTRLSLRFRHAVHGKRRIGVPLLVAGVSYLFRSVVETRRIRETCNNTV